MDLEYYWCIVLWDGERIKVKPQNVQAVQQKINSGEGFITTSTRSINIKDIKEFAISGDVFTDQKLLEGAAQAFGEPILLADGSVQASWVKQVVPNRRWENYYRFGAYRKLEENENSAIIAFRVPTHLINIKNVVEMDEKEIKEYHLNRSSYQI